MWRRLPIGVQNLLYRRQPALHGRDERAGLSAKTAAAGRGPGDGPDPSLAHIFECRGQHLLLDGATGALVRLAAAAAPAWRDWLTNTPAGGGTARSEGPPGWDEPVAAGLFQPPTYPVDAAVLQGLHSLCLNVAHACDLQCAYCFAAGGAYGGARAALMSPATARQAIDYLLANAPAGRTVNVDFFGGEPLLAWDTVEATVRYAGRRAASRGMGIHFTLTTNGVALTAAQARFCAEHMATVIVSLDGRPATHDRLRRTPDGGGSYQRALAGAGLMWEAFADRPPATAGDKTLSDRPDRPLGSSPVWVRGTYTAHNLDFSRDVTHLAQMGFNQISMEPVSAAAGDAHALRPEHLPALREAYAEVAALVAAGGARLFHYELNQTQPACRPKRYLGCAAGAGYACVNPHGEIYACHQFDGCAEFGQGAVATPAAAYAPCEPLAASHVGAKAACRACWAQLYCGGGCHYAAWRYGGGLTQPHALSCEITRMRLEFALALAAEQRPRLPTKADPAPVPV